MYLIFFLKKKITKKLGTFMRDVFDLFFEKTRNFYSVLANVQMAVSHMSIIVLPSAHMSNSV